MLEPHRPQLRIDPVEMIPAEDIHPHRESGPSETVEDIQRNDDFQVISVPLDIHGRHFPEHSGIDIFVALPEVDPERRPQPARFDHQREDLVGGAVDGKVTTGLES